jgi:hypothetical protein
MLLGADGVAHAFLHVAGLRGAGTGPERLQKVTFRAAGEKLSPLLDGTEQLISMTSVPWYQREIYLPGS